MILAGTIVLLSAHRRLGCRLSNPQVCRRYYLDRVPVCPAPTLYFSISSRSGPTTTTWWLKFKQNKRNSYGTSVKTSHLPLLHLSPSHVERVNSSTWMQIFRGSHMSRPSRPRQLRDYFLKQLRQACGCAPGPDCPVALFLYRGNQTCTGIAYAAPVWNHLLTKTQTDQIEAIQRRRALRII